MNVTFSSSGALSRAQYNLAHRLESANTAEEEDAIVREHIRAINYRLAHSPPPLSSASEILVSTLYALNYATTPLAPVMLDPILRLAADVASAGQSTKQKRIGYLFCTEVLPKGSGLFLMLVNMLRKDLESSHPPYIALALSFLINRHDDLTDALPAIQDILVSLLKHSSVPIRKRAICALSTIVTSSQDGLNEDIIAHLEMRASPKILKRLKLATEDLGVRKAALSLAAHLVESGSLASQEVVDAIVPYLSDPKSPLRHRALEVLARLLPRISSSSQEDILSRNISVLLKPAKHPLPSVIFVPLYRCLSALPTALLFRASASVLLPLRALLPTIGTNPNSAWTILTCLQLLDATLWTGAQTSEPTLPRTGIGEVLPNYLDSFTEQEVGKIMQGVYSTDSGIRHKTFIVLRKVDPSILDTYFTSLIFPPNLSSPPASRSSTPTVRSPRSPARSLPDSPSRLSGLSGLPKSRPRVVESSSRNGSRAGSSVGSVNNGITKSLDERRLHQALEVAGVLEDEGGGYAQRMRDVLTALAVSRSKDKGKGKEVDRKRVNAVDEKLVETVLIHLKTRVFFSILDLLPASDCVILAPPQGDNNFHATFVQASLQFLKPSHASNLLRNGIPVRESASSPFVSVDDSESPSPPSPPSIPDESVQLRIPDSPSIASMPTFIVIICAVLCEYCDSIAPSLNAVEIMQDLATLLKSLTASLQELIVLIIIRISALLGEEADEADQALQYVRDVIRHLQASSGRFIRKASLSIVYLHPSILTESQRCEQYFEWSSMNKRTHLRAVIEAAKSPTLPDFLMSLESPPPAPAPLTAISASRTNSLTPTVPSPRSPSDAHKSPSSPASSSLPPTSPRTTQLRYAAYEAPPIVPHKFMSQSGFVATPASPLRTRSSDINPFRDDPDEDAASHSDQDQDMREGFGVPSMSAGELALVVGSETPKKKDRFKARSPVQEQLFPQSLI
ncbi:ARM repeat-containing protein [Sistotremastrum niveocremeum HHB9708]|uniref:ARM repeat-containing protein n=1 Tax=Sistotremastrum niveocremeum HHB9708 TaxID=1314777 RepID=A0A164Y6H2_9AGAM|nr:ARM repeat-containing protein [Sistotremastrum niveocremeum HHB9708]